jgi:hypothetical protein
MITHNINSEKKNQHFEVDTENLEGITWSPSGSTFAIWESPIEVCAI